MEKILLPNSSEWKSADLLNDYDKQSIVVTLAIHAVLWFITGAFITLALILSLVVHGPHSFEHGFLYASIEFEWYQFAELVVALMVFWQFRSDVLRIRKIKNNDFKWTSAIVERISYGHHNHHPSLYTNLGLFRTGQIVWRFHREQEVVVVMYKLGATNKTLWLNLTYLFDPLAYVAQYHSN